jgi:hypothetical protein
MRVVNRLEGVPKQKAHSALDIETWGLDAREDGTTFALGVVVDERGARRFSERDAMRDWLLSRENRGRCFWAHNGGRFDYYSIFGNYVKRWPRSITMVGGKLIEMRIRESSGRNLIRFRDSMNVFPGPLARIGEAMGMPKGETPQKFIDADRSQPITEQDYQYCEQDTRILYTALMRMKETYEELRPTVPSLAMSVFRRHYMPANLWVRSDADFETRPAYFGGRVEAYYVGPTPTNTHYYDINSLYPHAMISTVFPDPYRLHRFGGRPKDGEEGIGYAVVTVPESCDPPPLPHRRGSDGRLLFPVGTLRGTWSLLELREAERLGCHVEWRGGISAPPVSSPFRAYVADQFAIKQKAAGLEREIAKLMLNALYGKFGEYHQEGSEYAEGFSEKRLAALREKFGPATTWRPLSRERADGYYAFPAAEGGIATHSIYSWAVQITAMARILNLRTQNRLKAAGIRCLYTDTDSFLADGSIITDAPALADMVGDGLGQLKEEKKTITEIFGAKDYATTEGHTLKGVRKTAELGEDGLYRFPTIMTAKEAIRRGMMAGEQKIVTKRGHAVYDKRVVLEDGWTRPVVIGV